MEAPSPKNTTPSALQRGLSLFFLGMLAVIAGVMLWLQNQYDPGAWRDQPSSPTAPAQTKETLPEGVVHLSEAEHYNARTLSDKINGKADLYLSAGFRSLESRRFALAADKGRWMERYLYDMGDYRNAFAVFSAQRRRDARKIDLASHAYLAANGLFMVHGPNYVEIIAAEASELMQSKMSDLASAFMESHPAAAGRIPELELFPPQHQMPNTSRLIADSAFGIQNMNWIFTSAYDTGQAEAVAFISKRATTAEAMSLAEAFVAYWTEYGAETVETPPDLEGAKIVLILDNYEIAMVQGEYFFGVHEATRLDFGIELAAQLQQALGASGQ